MSPSPGNLAGSPLPTIHFLLPILLLTGTVLSNCASHSPESLPRQENPALKTQIDRILARQTTTLEQVESLNGRIRELETRLDATEHKTRKCMDQYEHRLNFVETVLPIEGGKLGNKAQKTDPTGQQNIQKADMKERETVKNTPPPVPTVQALRTNEENARKAYISAYLALKSGHYEQANTAFNKFLSESPNSKYLYQAQYWLGETLHAQGRTREAIEVLRGATTAPENNPRWNAAMLRLGQLHQQSGHAGDARATLLQLIRRHPQSPEAEAAREFLSQAGANTGR